MNDADVMKDCCTMHAQIRNTLGNELKVLVRTLHQLGYGRTPRQVNSIYDYLRHTGLSNNSIRIAMMDDCPCKSPEFMEQLEGDDEEGET